jgi:hypothetical protein
MGFVWGIGDVDEADFVVWGFGDEADFVTKCCFPLAIMGFFAV